jgi:Prokaryotic membrane lipoprotein lipid attachment site
LLVVKGSVAFEGWLSLPMKRIVVGIVAVLAVAGC